VLMQKGTHRLQKISTPGGSGVNANENPQSRPRTSVAMVLVGARYCWELA
jgi:hypothetical protein